VNATVIASLPAFAAEGDRWADLYRADPLSQVFLSGAWLAAYLPGVRDPWSVLVLREGDELVAALPLQLRPLPHRRLPLARELAFATDPLADYQGLLCRPGREDEALDAFAAAIEAMRWDRAAFSDVRDPRFAGLVERLAGRAAVREEPPAACLAFDLPTDYETFLAGLSKPTRRATQRLLKSLAADHPDVRVSGPDEGGDLGAHVDAMVALNGDRFGSTSLRRDRLRALLRAAHDAGCLHVRIVWDGPRPVAGGAAFVDPVRGTFGLYLIGHDRHYDRHSPGKGIIGIMVRDAIAGGYREFDFLRGGESFKGSYADREVPNRHWRLRRAGVRNVLLDAAQPAYGAAKAAAVAALRRRSA
jgi:CelD/BcsL family acetyltransferase involved in cellulose biosynthesis